MKITTYGLDLAKRVFQLHWVDMETGEICRRQLKRAEVAEFFANRAPAVIAMEACGSAHYWARQFAALGHEVRLIAAQFVRPFVKSNKTDAADAHAIWEAAQRPGMKFVAVKSEGQQAVLTLHRMRELLVKMRTMQINQLRGLLYEFGAELPPGRQKGLARIPTELAKLEEALPAMVIEVMHGQLERIAALDEDIAEIERKLSAWKKEDAASRKLMDIPGVGLLTATAAVATIGDAGAFKSGREFAAFLGLVPRQCGTGGRVKLLGISKRGDVYLRTLLIHGARSVITRQKTHEPWLDNLLARRPFNAAVVALANKMARTIWALLALDRTYQKGYAATAA
ncbi:IS110 family transposase [Azoarcus sp. DN11]|uniref:IS110 family transposase n=1 Tax=Azoarcus sp. DN11 TaxID=356837 RepID=UPI000EAF2241|nr:IS110 family transposase [Azoarcus sp. DN11]AYH43375.1 IS110 family transposase [Azoarcus sp. DN11]